jgi:hypothetical protein
VFRPRPARSRLAERAQTIAPASSPGGREALALGQIVVLVAKRAGARRCLRRGLPPSPSGTKVATTSGSLQDESCGPEPTSRQP